MTPRNLPNLVRQLSLPLLILALVSNLAVLVNPIFMMQVLDRVVPSGNLATLVLLLFVALAAIGLQAAVDHARDNSFHRAGLWLEGVTLPPVLSLTDPAQKQQSVDDIATVARALKTTTAATALSLPWLPLFFLALFFVHWSFVVLVAALVAVQQLLRLSSERAQAPGLNRLKSSQDAETQSRTLFENATRSIGMLGLEQNLRHRHAQKHAERLLAEHDLDRLQERQTALSGFLRSATQLLALSLGAGLVAVDALSAGGMIAASIIVTKLVTMIEAASRNLPEIRAMHRAIQSLGQLPDAPGAATDVPHLKGHLESRSVLVPRGGGAPPLLDRVSFKIEPGECLAVLGASGSGKTTLLKVLAGVQSAPIGAVFYDETELKALPQSALAQHVGVLPQLTDLLEGTLAENICSFAQDPDADLIVAAAKLAGVHGLISSLPGGYDMGFKDAGNLLSAGQKQRVALARAIFHRPRYLFLDEPNALLDAEGERQLCDALARLKQEGTTVVMVVHRSGVLGLADKVLVLDNGRISDFGTRAEVLARYSVGRRRIELPLNQNSLQDLADWVASQFTRTGDEALQQKTVMVATELFNLACKDAAGEVLRKARLEFQFIDDNRCEITLSEDGKTAVEAKMAKVESLIRHPHVPMVDLESDEVALAMVAQVADSFDIRNDGDRAVFFAALSNQNPIASAKEARH